jgi:hypothetical protein
MINLRDEINTNRFCIGLDSDEYLAILRALYWYQDKLANQERSKGSPVDEWDTVIYLRQQLSNTLKIDTFIF